MNRTTNFKANPTETARGRGQVRRTWRMDASARCAGPIPEYRKQQSQRIQKRQQTGCRSSERICIGKSDLPLRSGKRSTNNMKILTIIARSLLGLIFVVFGANAFLHFIPMPPPEGLAGNFMKALFASHYYYVVAVLQIAGGALCVIGRFVPLLTTALPIQSCNWRKPDSGMTCSDVPPQTSRLAIIT